MASQPAAIPFLSSKQEHRKIHFFIYILRPNETGNPTKGSKAIKRDGLYRQGLVSWPKPDSQPSPVDSDSSSGSDAEWDFCELEPVAAPAPAKEYIPFESNPAILAHVQKGLKNHPLILTVDLFLGGFVMDKPDSIEQHEEKYMYAVKDFIKDPPNYHHQSEEAKAGVGGGEEAEEAASNPPQERKLLLSDDDERKSSIDATVFRIQGLIECCQVTIFKAVPSSLDKNNPKTTEEDLVMVKIQELEQGLQKLAKNNKADGVKFHWGLRNPLHGYCEEDGVFERYLYEKMVPRSRVEELRGLNREGCECGCW